MNNFQGMQPPRAPIRIFDLGHKRHLGLITSYEYNRLSSLYCLYKMRFEWEKPSAPAAPENEETKGYNQITSIEIAPKNNQFVGVLTKDSVFAIYDIQTNPKVYQTILSKRIPHDDAKFYVPPNSVHWLGNCNSCTIGTRHSIQFWDCTAEKPSIIVKMNTKVFNHVISTSYEDTTANDYVAVSGNRGNVFLIDSRAGCAVTESQTDDRRPIRTIEWHPTNNLQYAIGNDNGNIQLWDIRHQNNSVLKFTDDEYFDRVPLFKPQITGLRFYNNGASILSVDINGDVLSWDVGSGRIQQKNYDRVPMCNLNRNTFYKEFQFSTTKNLKQDIAFMPSEWGLYTFDINTGNKIHAIDNHCSIICTTYDPRTLRVYGSTDNFIMSWAPRPPSTDEVVA
ncbi:DNA excision repair protein ERCC-8-like [Adelges cooleyi]|uniref:DNA excision repair protein ERCC-8-like n=1 Tax=Adelges cooleyi TaxID=133065 RepID=UPI00217FFDCC|nr:DNA excision repair protein ERCC-8-like [Adelges cooleyi]XP_050438855.1 DNA excision repair protein ERCC-8-like [Adelges cooleyi]